MTGRTPFRFEVAVTASVMLALLAGCVGPMRAAPAGMAERHAAQVAAPAAPIQVGGTVGYRERLALDPSAEIVVQVLDVSVMDAPATVMAEQRLRADGRQVPFEFELNIDPAHIDPRGRYVVSARILQGERVLFYTDTQYPVLTHWQGTRISLMLARAVDASR